MFFLRKEDSKNLSRISARVQEEGREGKFCIKTTNFLAELQFGKLHCNECKLK